MLENFHWYALDFCASFFPKHNSFWELTTQFLGNQECVKNIDINFCNSSTLSTFFHWQLSTERICVWKDPHKATCALLWNFLHSKVNFKPYKSAEASCLSYVVLLSFSSFVQSVSTLFRRFTLKFRLKCFRLPSTQTSQLYMKRAAIFMEFPSHDFLW